MWEENASECTGLTMEEYGCGVVVYKRKGQKCSRKAGDIHFCMSAFKGGC
jgi:hypothetical protein